jgi:hypothetical protein
MSSFNKDPPTEPARKKAQRRWRNYEIASRFKKLKEQRPQSSDRSEEDEFHIFDGKKFFAAEVPKPPRDEELLASILTPSDEDVENIDKLRQKRDRRLYKFLVELVRVGRNTITVTGPELTGPQRDVILAGSRSIVERRKRRLLMEKLRRLENGTYGCN